MTRRVVVTGVGLVCALGIGTEESWRNLLAGCSGIAPITSFDTTGFDCKFGGEVKNFDPLQWIEKKELKKMARFIQVGLAGADFAVKSANWKPQDSNLDEVGVYVSSGIGGFDIIEREHGKLLNGGPNKISPFSFPRPSLIWLRDKFLFVMGRVGRIPRQPRRVLLPRMPLAIPSRLSSAAPQK